MSVRTQVIIDHDVDNYRDREATVKLLQPSLRSAMAVDDYLYSVEPPGNYGAPVNLWIPQKEHTVVSYVDYLGPGGILLHFSRYVAVISASLHWSGLLEIEPVRSIHLAAFRSVARCLGGTRLVIMPSDSDVGWDAMREGLSQDQCIARIRHDYGPPQASAEAFASADFTKLVHGSHLVWFIEPL